MVDTSLRNDIAHLNFTIVNGEICIRGRKSEEIVNSAFEKVIAAVGYVALMLHRTATDLGWAKVNSFFKILINYA